MTTAIWADRLVCGRKLQRDRSDQSQAGAGTARAAGTVRCERDLRPRNRVSEVSSAARRHLGAQRFFSHFACNDLWPGVAIGKPGWRHLHESKIGVTPITDLELGYQMTDTIKFSLGANNLFNRYPDKKNSELLAVYRSGNDNAAVEIYPEASPHSGLTVGTITASSVSASEPGAACRRHSLRASPPPPGKPGPEEDFPVSRASARLLPEPA